MEERWKSWSLTPTGTHGFCNIHVFNRERFSRSDFTIALHGEDTTSRAELQQEAHQRIDQTRSYRTLRTEPE